MEYKDNLYASAGSKIFKNANDLRKKQTQAEKILWEKLRNRNLLDYKFRRQHPIAQFIADFYCHKLKLIIELDGDTHNAEEQKKYDNARTLELEQLGIKVLRLTNGEIINDTSSTVEKIKTLIDSFIAPPSLQGEGGRGDEASTTTPLKREAS